jgi:hypothetical protein
MRLLEKQVSWFEWNSVRLVTSVNEGEATWVYGRGFTTMSLTCMGARDRLSQEKRLVLTSR